RVAAAPGVDEPDLAVGEPQQGVVLDDLPVGAGGGDAVAQEHDRVAVAEGEVGGPGGGGQDEDERGDGEGDSRRAHGDLDRRGGGGRGRVSIRAGGDRAALVSGRSPAPRPARSARGQLAGGGA